METLCKLCLESRQLCDSHVIPEFFYEAMYSENHRFALVTANFGGKASFPRKGIQEKLLCKRCEGFLNENFESYSRNVLYGMEPLRVLDYDGGHVFFDIDYAKFKLFQMSILWRMGISKHEFFENVQLGKYEELLRQRIYDSQPGEEWEFGCIMTGVILNDRILDDLMTQPQCVKIEGHTAYKLVARGIAMVFFVSNHTKDLSQQSGFLKRSGELRFPVLPAERIDVIRGHADLLKKVNSKKPIIIH